MAQRHATYENSNRSHQIPCEKSFPTVYGLPIFADPRVWLLIPWLDWLAMKGGMGSIPFCSEFWSNVVLVVNGVDLEEVTKFIFAFKMYGVP